MSAGHRRAKGAEREQAVVEAAAHLIATRGLGELRMADVAEQAGMSVGHVTYYFPTKNELLVRAITTREQAFQEQVGASLKGIEPAWERLLALVELAAAAGPRDADWLLWFEVWAHAAGDPMVADAQRALDGWWRETMAAVVADGIRRREFRCDDPERAVDVLSALTDGLSVRLVLDGSPLTRSRLLDRVTSVARELLGVRP